MTVQMLLYCDRCRELRNANGLYFFHDKTENLTGAYCKQCCDIIREEYFAPIESRFEILDL